MKLAVKDNSDNNSKRKKENKTTTLLLRTGTNKPNKLGYNECSC